MTRGRTHSHLPQRVCFGVGLCSTVANHTHTHTPDLELVLQTAAALTDVSSLSFMFQQQTTVNMLLRVVRTLPQRKAVMGRLVELLS